MNRSANSTRRSGRAAALAAIVVTATAVRAAPAPATKPTPATKPAPATRPLPPPAPSAAAKPSPTAANDPIPTQLDVQAAFDAKDYPGTLQKLQRVLILRGKAAETYDRHALLVLKAETHLRMKAAGPAAQAYAEAAKVAVDGLAAAADIATEMLVRRSGAGLAYQPKAKDPADKSKALPPIDVVEPDSRKKALAALFADEWAVVEPRVRSAARAPTLAPVMEVLPAVRDLRWVEMAAGGRDDKSRELGAGLVARAKGTIEASVKDMTTSVDGIELAAMQVTSARVPRLDQQTGRLLGFDTKYRRVGPTPRQTASLRDAFDTTTKIRDSCDLLGGSLGATGHEFDEVKAKADQLRLRAGTLLDTDWTAKYDLPPQAPKPKA